MTCATVRIEAETYETVETSLRIASTSSSESFELAPKPARAPDDVTLPGITMRKFVPRDLSWFSLWMRAPFADPDDRHDARDADDDPEGRQEGAQLVAREGPERDLEDVRGLLRDHGSLPPRRTAPAR